MKKLRPVHPSAGLEADYRRQLTRLIQQMHDSVLYWLRAAYRRDTPHAMAADSAALELWAVSEVGLTMDELPAAALQKSVNTLRRRWTRRWRETSGKLADYFAQSVEDRVAGTLRRILAEGGVLVKFQMTPAMRDVVSATVKQSVALIRSIPAQYFAQVEGIVMRGVQSGRDLGQVTRDLQNQLGVTKRRAALIAQDQNNKATASMTRVRQLEAGITKARWLHSAGGREPRPTHVKAGRDRTVFDVSKGWYDPHEKRFIQPGELINCRCVSVPVIEGVTT